MTQGVMLTFLGWVAAAALGGVGLRLARRSARDVAEELRIEPAAKRRLVQGSFPDASARSRGVSGGRLLIAAGALGGLLARSVVFPGTPLQAVVAALSCGAAAFLVERARTRKHAEEKAREVEFYLPLLMEHLVMAVEAGLDVISGMKRVVEVRTRTAGGKRRDRATEALQRVIELTEQGLGFEESLRTVGAEADYAPLRHAFIHLGLAHREGGELIKPLRELSRSTQLAFQEVIEERIAVLPVKATAPLLCTFAGLIVCFITTPLIQVMSLTEKAIPSEERALR